MRIPTRNTSFQDRTGGWLITFLIPVVILLAHASTASYMTGYLLYFGVEIKDIDFWPSIIDFMTAPIGFFILLLGSLGAVLAGVWIVLLLISRVDKILHKYFPSGPFGSFSESNSFSKNEIWVFVLLCISVLSINLLYSTYIQHGRDAAENRKVFTQLIDQSQSEPQIVVYQNNNQAILKSYDRRTKKFADSYTNINMEDKTFKKVSLDDL